MCESEAMTQLLTNGVLNRRLFLRQLALVGAGGVLAACTGSSSSSSGSEAPASSSPASSSSASADPGAAAIRAIAPDATNDLAVVAATFEQLVDQPNPFVFGLFTLEQEPIEDARAELYAVPSGGEPLGPWPAEPSGANVPPGGLYTVPVEFSSTGVHEMVVVTEDGRAGAVAVEVRDAESSVLPAPGQQAQAVATPTTEDALGYERVCTRPEPCGMHDVSLDEALAGDTPVVLVFATPAFCQTAVCGPTVDVIEQVRQDGFDDVTFVHCEIFSDAGETLGDPVVAWNLPTEPWMFVIDAGGTIVGRADGPLLVVADEVRTLISDGIAV
jgi:hypothetical protein